MPRRWPDKCRMNPRHAGPISRSGLCPTCRREICVSSGSAGGKAHRLSFYRRPSFQTAVRRKATRRMKPVKSTKMARGKVAKVVKVSGKTKNRFCFRCRQRVDACRIRGFIPYRCCICRVRFMRFLKEFDDEGDDVRFTSELWDVQIVKAWATMAKQYIYMYIDLRIYAYMHRYVSYICTRRLRY